MAEFEYSHDKHVLGTDWKSRVGDTSPIVQIQHRSTANHYRDWDIYNLLFGGFFVKLPNTIAMQTSALSKCAITFEVGTILKGQS